MFVRDIHTRYIHIYICVVCVEQLGYGWEGCITTAPPVVAYDHDYGEPVGQCKVSKSCSYYAFPINR